MIRPHSAYIHRRKVLTVCSGSINCQAYFAYKQDIYQDFKYMECIMYEYICCIMYEYSENGHAKSMVVA